MAAAGYLLIGHVNTVSALVGLGMLAYTVIQSPGYSIARRELVPAATFVGLFALTAVAIGAIAVL